MREKIIRVLQNLPEDDLLGMFIEHFFQNQRETAGKKATVQTRTKRKNLRTKSKFPRENSMPSNVLKALGTTPMKSGEVTHKLFQMKLTKDETAKTKQYVSSVLTNLKRKGFVTKTSYGYVAMNRPL